MTKKKKRAGTKRQTSQKSRTGDRARSPRVLEAVGVVMMLAALGLCLALWSYDPSDSSGQENLLGQVGRGLADLVLGAAGVVGYLAGLLSVALAGAVLFGRLHRPNLLTLVSGASVVLGTAVAAYLQGGDILGKPAGGDLGLVLGSGLVEQVGTVGATLVAIGAVLLGLMGLIELSPARLLLTIGSGVAALVYGMAARIGDAWAAWRAARERVRAVEAAARAVEAEEAAESAGIDLPLSDIRAAQRAERRRAKVARAAAEAEARALERLARQRKREVDDDEPALGDFEEIEDLNLEGPGVESELDWGPVENAADVLERVSPEESESKTLPPEPDSLLSEEPREARGGEPKESEGEENADFEVDAFDSSGGPLIHERKQTEVRFDEEVSDLPSRTKEKKVYRLPPLNLLDHEGDVPDPINELVLRERATRLEQKLETYGVRGKVMAIRPGPVVTTYEYQPAPGVKVAKIANLQDDIAMSMEALRVRIVAPIPGRGVVGIELPNERRENVYLKEIIAHDRFKKSKSLLALALGKDAEGDPQVRDLQKMPHLLVAGTTGSGKSVSINTVIISMLYKATPEQVKLIMVDPKMLELSLYNDIPHLLLPVVTDPRHASLALQWAVDEMERRYKLLSDFKVRDLESFNKKLERLRAQREADAAHERAVREHEAKVAEAEAMGSSPPEEAFFDEAEGKGRVLDPWKNKDIPEPLPYLVVLIDEFADLMTVAPRDVETSVQRLAQKARAAGLHVLLATQRPSTDVITGVIKNNFPCRVAFRVASRHDSATIINMPGAEALLGRGDSLLMDTSSPTPTRIHGSFVSEEEVERVVEFWKEQGRPVYDPTILEPREEEGEGGFNPDDVDEHYDVAVRIVTETRRASISALQRRLRVGYNRAARMIEMMEAQGIVGPAMGAKGEREVLVSAMDADGPR